MKALILDSSCGGIWFILGIQVTRLYLDLEGNSIMEEFTFCCTQREFISTEGKSGLPCTSTCNQSNFFAGSLELFTRQKINWHAFFANYKIS